MNKRIIIFLTILAVSIVAFAQKGLKVDRFFNEPTISSQGVTYLTASGKQLDEWDGLISLYRSLKVTGNQQLLNEIERAIKTDGTQAVTRTVHMNEGLITYGFYVLPANGKINRYLITTAGTNETTGEITINLYYIEGKVSPEKFDSILKS